MSRILYGVAGEGSGHSSRAKIIIEHLLAQGHEVVIVSHDQGYENLSRYFNVEKITGLRISYRNNAVQYISTALRTLGKIPGSTVSLNRIFGILDEKEFDLVITDFEPLSAFAANIRGIPVLSIDNQHVMTGTRFECPDKFQKEKMIIKNVIRYIIPPADAYFVTTFFTPPLINRKTKLFPPIVRSEVLALHPEVGEHVLVYTTTENKELIPILAKMKVRAFIYGATHPAGTSGTLVYKKHSHDEFLEDLRTCRAVIGSAGFSLISESLTLHKPYFALPVVKQFEQILNAYYLQKMHYGDYSLRVKREALEHFLSHLHEYRTHLDTYAHTDNNKILSAIDTFISQASQK